MRNLLCLLPDYCFEVVCRLPHPCGGYFTQEVRCYGPHGFVGYSMQGARGELRS